MQHWRCLQQAQDERLIAKGSLLAGKRKRELSMLSLVVAEIPGELTNTKINFHVHSHEYTYMHTWHDQE